MSQPNGLDGAGAAADTPTGVDAPTGVDGAWQAFEGCGIELEYMLVEAGSLSVWPAADVLLREAAGGRDTDDLARGEHGWSNELAAHVLEVKNLHPAPDLRRLAAGFESEVRWMNAQAARLGARLMPSAMHPWMDPSSQTRLWPRDPARIYATYDRIFDCRRHGWSNLQSMHVNLPFAGDAQFVRLHDALRLVLPVLPALAASSPFAEGRATGWLDWRLETYRTNASSFPPITGLVVPEPVDSQADYRARILAPMYRAIARLDPDRVLAHEWLNSHGAIARFARGAIEIRVLDMQECLRADLAIAAATCALARALYDARWREPAAQRLPTARLAAILQACAREAERAVIDDADYLACLGFAGRRCQAGELWAHLIEALADGPPEAAGSAQARRAPIGAGIAPDWRVPLRRILEQGPLARRLLRAAGPQPPPARLVEIARTLCGCLRDGRMFEAID